MIEYLLLIMGLFLLLKGADLLIDGSSSIAAKFKISYLVVGLTIVAFGTSLPELLINIFAAFKGSSEIALGNIIGSNLANILLILGIGALMYPIKITKTTIWKEIPFSILAVVLLIIFSNYYIFDGIIQDKLLRVHGIILIFFFIIFLYYVLEIAKTDKKNMKLIDSKIKIYSNKKTYLMIFLGLIGLYFGGKFTIESTIIIAKNIGFSEYFISATIIALGTSLPELITTIIAVFKKKIDLAIGNVIGSNIFNIFWVLGITSVIKPIIFPSIIFIDLMILLIASFLLFLFMFVGSRHSIDKWQGILFIIMYLGYIIFLIFRG
jgi:cation:H+ antiporter